MLRKDQPNIFILVVYSVVLFTRKKKKKSKQKGFKELERRNRHSQGHNNRVQSRLLQ